MIKIKNHCNLQWFFILYIFCIYICIYFYICIIIIIIINFTIMLTQKAINYFQENWYSFEEIEGIKSL